jgi:hypothetical protein
VGAGVGIAPGWRKILRMIEASHGKLEGRHRNPYT